MRATSALWQHAVRLTFFTRANCGLCTDAKQVLLKVWDRRHFAFTEIDVMAAGHDRWKALYEFDTPVVHFDRNNGSETSGNSRKLMHRFTEQDVEHAMDDVEKK
ncbi:hypothetical protein EJ03DRAFT_267983 [Teratosphaeria nubilosa]|uniref:Glutaredoxin-like protein n=1 Tax=Teratosphaeria nubilosa TaxID=161662 RepID=A0A6G1LGP7_9PEZI|nr:hypothetical protein EJ03DRAFT_267983 [Teratosphaeria nubilosa]